MIHDRETPPSNVVLGTAYRNSQGEVFVWDTAIGDDIGVAWRPAKVVYTVFGVAPEAVEFDLAAFSSPSKVNEGRRLHWNENAVVAADTWPPLEITHGIGRIQISTHGDDTRSYLLEVSGFDLKVVEQRWRHIAHTLVPADLWRELEPLEVIS